MKNNRELSLQAADIRLKTVELICQAQGGHIGGDLSCTDILVTLFNFMKHNPNNPYMRDRDRFILSKGHAAEVYYVILAEYGYISWDELNTYKNFNSKFGGHPTKEISGVEANTGSLGHGLSLGVGMALAMKMNGGNNRVYVLCGDGELGEGSNWEAAMAASKFGLNNLFLIIDRNNLQISGTTEDVMPLEPLQDKFKSFGFTTAVIDGHNIKQIQETISTAHKTKPKAIIANTIKTKGFKCGENNPGWHHKTPTLDQLNKMRIDTENLKKELSV